MMACADEGIFEPFFRGRPKGKKPKDLEVFEKNTVGLFFLGGCIFDFFVWGG